MSSKCKTHSAAAAERAVADRGPHRRHQGVLLVTVLEELLDLLQAEAARLRHGHSHQQQDGARHARVRREHAADDKVQDMFAVSTFRVYCCIGCKELNGQPPGHYSVLN